MKIIIIVIIIIIIIIIIITTIKPFIVMIDKRFTHTHPCLPHLEPDAEGYYSDGEVANGETGTKNLNKVYGIS
jgi:hypothetical protein